MPFSKKSEGEFYFDSLDLKVLKRFSELNGKEISWWKMMQDIFPKAKSQSEKNNCYKVFRGRVNNLVNLGIIDSHKRKDGTPIWEIDEEKVFFKRMRMPNGLRDFVGVIVEEKWQIIEFSE